MRTQNLSLWFLSRGLRLVGPGADPSSRFFPRIGGMRSVVYPGSGLQSAVSHPKRMRWSEGR